METHINYCTSKEKYANTLWLLHK